MLEYSKDKSTGIDIRKKIDVLRLKSEIKALSGELTFLKGRVRDPELNQAAQRYWQDGPINESLADQAKEFNAAHLRRYKTRRRFNKLVTLRALMRGKIHFHKNTKYENVDYALSKLSHTPTKEDLLVWVAEVRKEFEASE